MASPRKGFNFTRHVCVRMGAYVRVYVCVCTQKNHTHAFSLNSKLFTKTVCCVRCVAFAHARTHARTLDEHASQHTACDPRTRSTHTLRRVFIIIHFYTHFHTFAPGTDYLRIFRHERVFRIATAAYLNVPVPADIQTHTHQYKHTATKNNASHQTHQNHRK